MVNKFRELTYKQKLDAIALRFYGGFKWEPKVGDYYTTPRADLELYRIVEEDEEYFYTVYTSVENCHPAQWKKTEFLEKFGIHRTYVPTYLLKNISYLQELKEQ